MAEKAQPKFPNTNMLALQLWVLTIAMFVVYIYYSIVGCFFACEWDVRSLNTGSNDDSKLFFPISHTLAADRKSVFMCFGGVGLNREQRNGYESSLVKSCLFLQHYKPQL